MFPASDRLFNFVGGGTGEWSVVSITAVVGESLPAVERVKIVAGDVAGEQEAGWVLRGVTSNQRYVNAEENKQLTLVQSALGRPEATHVALIPIRKSAAWWAMPQDQRRAIFEEQSRHIAIGMKYLPAIARRLHHCRDMGTVEPFDFLTLFDFAESDASAFNEMLIELRASAEWKYVEREVDIRMVRTK